MIPSARPTIPSVASDPFSDLKLFCFARLNNYHYRLELWVGRVDQLSYGIFTVNDNSLFRVAGISKECSNVSRGRAHASPLPVNPVAVQLEPNETNSTSEKSQIILRNFVELTNSRKSSGKKDNQEIIMRYKKLFNKTKQEGILENSANKSKDNIPGTNRNNINKSTDLEIKEKRGVTQIKKTNNDNSKMPTDLYLSKYSSVQNLENEDKLKDDKLANIIKWARDVNISDHQIMKELFQWFNQ